jgi:hypothetical protein
MYAPLWSWVCTVGRIETKKSQKVLNVPNQKGLKVLTVFKVLKVPTFPKVLNSKKVLKVTTVPKITTVPKVLKVPNNPKKSNKKS